MANSAANSLADSLRSIPAKFTSQAPCGGRVRMPDPSAGALRLNVGVPERHAHLVRSDAHHRAAAHAAGDDVFRHLRQIRQRAALVAATVLSCAVAVPITTAQRASAQDLPTFRIGVMNDQSSLYSDIAGPGSVTAAQMVVADFQPEKHGFKVEVVSADHQNKVDAMVDVPTSSVALADISRDKNKVFLVASAGTCDLTAKACTSNTVHWTYDTWALANGTAAP